MVRRITHKSQHSSQHTATQQQTTASSRWVGFHQLNSYESYLASSLAIYDLIAAVAEVGAVDDDQVPNAVLALALATMDQIEDDEEGIVAAVDCRFVKFYSSSFSVCLRRGHDRYIKIVTIELGRESSCYSRIRLERWLARLSPLPLC